MEGELKLLLRQFKHKATSTYSYLIASKLNNAILIDPVKEEIKKYQKKLKEFNLDLKYACLLYTSPSPRDRTRSRMPSSA